MIGLHSCAGPLAAGQSAGPRVSEIMAEVARCWGVSVGDLTGPDRTASISEPRSAVCWIAVELARRSSTQTGAVLGRDHSTVLAAADAAHGRIVRNPLFRARLIAAATALGLGPQAHAALPRITTPQEETDHGE